MSAQPCSVSAKGGVIPPKDFLPRDGGRGDESSVRSRCDVYLAMSLLLLKMFTKGIHSARERLRTLFMYPYDSYNEFARSLYHG